MNVFCNHYLQILSLEYFSYGRTIEEKKKTNNSWYKFSKKERYKKRCLEIG